jgi:hypothetical protein
LVAIIIAAPLSSDDTHDLITLFGIAFTGMIALSSTTLASNAMAGLKENAKAAEGVDAEKVMETIARRKQIREKIVERIEKLESEVKD